MLSRLGDARTTVARSLRRSLPRQVRHASSSSPASLADAGNPVAKKLQETGIWTSGGRRKRGSVVNSVDSHRVNVVSSALCADIIKYIGPSLERHRGCDLVDLNPGAGVWSEALHDFLEPRKHILMDIDAEVYKPFLKDLLAKDGVELIHKSGIIWKDLLNMLSTSLAHQQPSPKDQQPRRNDTLLVTANLCTSPKRKFNGFDSVSTMVIYQFMSSIRASSLFQRYGCVRMLLWVNDEDKRRILPRSLTRRRRGAFEAELSCDWVHEVAGFDIEHSDRFALRDEWINVESGYNTVAKMQANGMEMPSGRWTNMYKQIKEDPGLMGVQLAGERPPLYVRPYNVELDSMEVASKLEDVSRLKYLRTRDKTAKGHSQIYHKLLQEFSSLTELYKTATPKQFAAADKAWNDQIDELKKNQRNEFLNLKDSYHLFRQPTAGLLWDRREYEPLVAKPDEFFPNAPTALLDIQPKPMAPLFRQQGPHSTRAGDMSDVMLRTWFQYTLLPAPKSMELLAGGFGNMLSACPSLTDPARGGLPMSGWGELPGRAVNETQWAEIVEAWMEWPFRPTYEQILGRLMEDEEVEDDGGAMGS